MASRKLNITSLRHSPEACDPEPDPYIYKSLEEHTSRFRLFHLQPAGANPSIICGFLLEFSLDDHPLYESLSYAWCESKKNETILLDDKSLNVTQSLRTALSYLRLSDEERILWIDQICIDQENLDERSHQVLQMSKIYKEATCNTAWLDEPDDDTAVAFDLIKRLVNRSIFSVIKRPMEPWSASHIRDMYDMISVSPPSTIELHELGVTQITPREPQALIAKFRKRRIWSRIWIIQEFVFAQKMIVQCGYHTLDWENIDYVMSSHICRPGFLYRYHYSVTRALVLAFENSLSIFNVRVSLLRNRLAPWTEMLTLTRQWEATDDRDRVYALLGISEDIGIMPDYRKSVHDTFVATAVAILNHNKNLDILCRNRPYIASDTLHQYSMELPSWVPRFGTKAAEIHLGNMFYDASRGCPNFDFEYPEGLGMLSVHGKHVDYAYITFGQRVTPEGHKSPVWHNALQYKAPWLILLLLQKSLSQSQSKDALWRTVIMNRGYNDGAPGPLRENEVSAYRKEYQQWLSSIMASTNDRLPAADTNFTRSATYGLMDRFITVTRQGRFASVPWDAKIGDEICVLHGAKMPIIFRRDENARFYKLVGVAYVHGLMSGEVFESAALFPSQEYTIG